MIFCFPDFFRFCFNGQFAGGSEKQQVWPNSEFPIWTLIRLLLLQFSQNHWHALIVSVYLGYKKLPTVNTVNH